MNRAGHIAGSAPVAVLGGAFVPAPTVDGLPALSPTAEVVARVAFGVIVVATSSVNDWDHPRFRDRVHPGAALVRWSARLAYGVRTAADLRRWEETEAWLVRTGRDYDPDDMHRGPSHCLEWCALLGALVTLVVAQAPPLWASAWWWGLAVFLATASHVVLDAMTPSGVPVSALYNYMRYGEVWRRHAFAWRWRPLGTFRAPGIAPRDVELPLVGVRPVPWVALVERDLEWPRLTVIPVDRSAHGCRAGLFYTDDAIEHLVVVPLAWLTTSVLVLALTGSLFPVLYAVTGWPMFGGA